MLPTFIVYDINSDGLEDLMLWTDFYGSYGDPSYTYYLFDPIHQAFVEAPELAKATHGFTLSRIRGNQLDLWYRDGPCLRGEKVRSEEHTSELQSLMRISYAVFCLQKQTHRRHTHIH